MTYNRQIINDVISNVVFMPGFVQNVLWGKNFEACGTSRNGEFHFGKEYRRQPILHKESGNTFKTPA